MSNYCRKCGKPFWNDRSTTAVPATCTCPQEEVNMTINLSDILDIVNKKAGCKVKVVREDK